jgi:hypothetical protein
VLEDSVTFSGQGDEQHSDAVQPELDARAGQATKCCGGPQAANGDEPASSGVCADSLSSSGERVPGRRSGSVTRSDGGA